MLYKKKGSNIYHWHKDCSQVPGNVYHNQYWIVLSGYASPSGTACKQCAELDMKATQRGIDSFTWKLTQT